MGSQGLGGVGHLSSGFYRSLSSLGSVRVESLLSHLHKEVTFGRLLLEKTKSTGQSWQCCLLIHWSTLPKFLSDLEIVSGLRTCIDCVALLCVPPNKPARVQMRHPLLPVTYP